MSWFYLREGGFNYAGISAHHVKWSGHRDSAVGTAWKNLPLNRPGWCDGKYWISCVHRANRLEKAVWPISCRSAAILCRSGRRSADTFSADARISGPVRPVKRQHQADLERRRPAKAEQCLTLIAVRKKRNRWSLLFWPT